MSSSPPSALAAAAVLLAVLVAAAAAAPPTPPPPYPPPYPSIDGDLKIELTTKLFEPWGNDSYAIEGSSYAIGASVARVQLGPCAYRAYHWHALAWEVFTLVHGQGPVKSVMVAPGAGGQQVRADVLRRGDSVAYPAGWAHYQLNDGCRNATALLVWNAVHSGGVNNVPQQLRALPEGYRGAVFGRRGGAAPRAGFWLLDEACAERCGLAAPAGEVDDEGEETAPSGGGGGRRRAGVDGALLGARR